MIRTVEVTQDDIGRGVRNTWRGCPVGRAVQRALRAHPESTIRRLLGRFGKTCLYPWPDAVIEFAEAFDAGLPVRPFRFEVKVPCR